MAAGGTISSNRQGGINYDNYVRYAQRGKRKNAVPWLAQAAAGLAQAGTEKDNDAVGTAERPPFSFAWGNVYGEVFQAQPSKYDISVTNTVETEKFFIEKKGDGCLYIHDKESGETFHWNPKENNIQVDAKTGLKFLINNFGGGIFDMVVVDKELEQGIKEALGVSELEEKPLMKFTVRMDSKTGIHYITSNGNEGSGGLLIMDDEARTKLDFLARKYLEQYPNLVKTYEEAWSHASFEVRGMTKRIPEGILQLGPNSISFLNRDGSNSWACIFDSKKWHEVKGKFYDVDQIGEEKWEFWTTLFHALQIEASLLVSDGMGRN